MTEGEPSPKFHEKVNPACAGVENPTLEPAHELSFVKVIFGATGFGFTVIVIVLEPVELGFVQDPVTV